MRNFLRKLGILFAQGRKSRFWRGTAMTLACTVIFVTTYAMILPAITIEQDVAENMPGMFLDEDEQNLMGEEFLLEEEEFLLEEEGGDVALELNEAESEKSDSEVAAGEEPAVQGEGEEEPAASGEAEELFEQGEAEEESSLPNEGETEERNPESEATGTVEGVVETAEGEAAEAIGTAEAEENTEAAEEEFLLEEEFSFEEEFEAIDPFLIEVEQEKTEVVYPAVTMSGNTDELDVLVEAPEGALPAGVAMELTPVDGASILDQVQASVEGKVTSITAVDITFVQEGEKIQPAVPVKVTLQKREFALASEGLETDVQKYNQMGMPGDFDPEEFNLDSEEGELNWANVHEEAGKGEAATFVFHVNEAGEAAVVNAAAQEYEAYVFEADEFSVYAIVETETITAKYITVEGDTYTITVVYGKDAKIPAGATLDVKEIVNGDKDYTDYVEQAAKVLSESEEVPFINDARLFDISIMAEGKKVEPKVPVEVRIEYTKAMRLNETSEVGTVHFKDNTADTEIEVVDIEVQGEAGKLDGVTFRTDSFSIYAVVIIDKEAGRFVVEDEEYRVTITYTKEANIPIGTRLIVEQIECDSAEYWDLVEKTVKEINKGLEWEDRDQPDPRKGIADAVFFDISLVNGTEEIEPDVPLQVTIEYKKNGILVPQDETAGVIHFGKTETQIIDDLKLVTESIEQQDGMPEDLQNGEIITSMTYEQEGFSPVGTYSTTVYLGDAVDDTAPRRALAAPKAGETHISASKTVEDLDGDGIYELALSVTGASDTTGTTTVSKSNVIIVMDTSSSMNNGHTYVSYKYDAATYSSSATYRNGNTNQSTRLYWRTDVTTPGWYDGYGMWATRYGDASLQVYRYDTWLNAEKEALYALINALLAKNEDRVQDGVDLSDIIEISLIDFNADAENRVTHYDNKNPSYTTNEAQLDSIISGMGYETGTNWEDGLLHAYKEASWYEANQSDESVHIIFLTDGEPYNYNKYDSSGNVTGNTHGDQGTAWTNASDDARRLIYDNGASTGWLLYGIFTYGDTTGGRKLKNLVNYAYTGTGNANSPITNQNWNTATITNEDKFYYASNTSGLLNYFQKIIDSVTNTVGYAGVEWEDGVTLGVTNTSVTVNGTIHESSITYKVKSGNTTLYTVKIANGVATFNISGQEEPLTDNTPETVTTKIDPDDSSTWIESTVYSVTVGGTEYKMSPATIDPDTGLVDWDLAGIGILENGYTYEMTFDVWPNQLAYDLVADRNNGVKTLAQIKAELIAEYGEEDGTALYDQIVAALVDNGDGTYSILTNWKQEVNYYTADVEKDEDGNVISTTYTSHDPYEYEYQRSIALTSAPLTMIKKWDSSLDESQYGNLLWKDYPNNTDPTEYQVKLHVWKADTATELQNLIDQYAGDPTTASANDYLEKTLGWNADFQEYVWTSTLAIAPGTMVSVDTARDEMGLTIDPSRVVTYDYDGDGTDEEYYIVETGHYYYVTEDNIDWHFELQTIVYHPMLVNGNLCNVNFVTDASGNVTGVENIENMSEVQATNSKTAELDITKKIVDNTGKMTQAQMDAETFTYKVTLTVPIDADMSHTNALEWVPRYNDNVSASNRYYIYGYQTNEDPSLLGFDDDVTKFNRKVYGQYTVSYQGGGATLDEIFTNDAGGTTKSGTIYVTLKQNEVIRFTNLPSDTHYRIEEIYNNLYQADPSRDVYANLGANAPDSNIDAKYNVTIATKNGESTVSGRVVEGTITQLNKRYYNQFTNTVKSNDDLWTELKVKKITEGYTWRDEFYRFFLYAGEATYSDGLTPATGTSPIHVTHTIKDVDCSRVDLYERTNDHSHEISFGNVLFTRPGTYTYEIRENDNSSNYPHVQFAAPVTVTVTVEKGEDNKLHITGVTDDSGTTGNSVVNAATTESLESTTTNMTNRIVPTDVAASKQWLDAAGNVIADVDLPSGIKATFELLADGEPTGNTIELDGEIDTNGELQKWKATFRNVPKYKEVITTEGEQTTYTYPEIMYTIRENSVSSGFTKLTQDPVSPDGIIQNKQQPILVSLQKIGDNNLENLLSDAVFKLYSDEDFETQVMVDALGSSIGGTQDGTITTVNGIADIGSLAVGTYYLVEEVAPSGYNNLSGAVKIYVTATSEGAVVRYVQDDYTVSETGGALFKIYHDAQNTEFKADCKATTSDPYANDEEYTFVGYCITVNNNSGHELPHTGGPGTLLYTLSGIALMLGAALMYGFRLRRRERRFN